MMPRKRGTVRSRRLLQLGELTDREEASPLPLRTILPRLEARQLWGRAMLQAWVLAFVMKTRVGPQKTPLYQTQVTLRELHVRTRKRGRSI